jgi:hypothetical protein
MPAPSNPPFEAGALLQPRQLQRWLDVNKVNKLTRAETYLEIPAFSIETQWKGYSEIVGVFNFAAGRNFSLKNLEIPVNPNYVACIAWLDESGNTARYSLWRHTNDVFYFPLEQYRHQRIFGNFRVEIWSVEPVFTTFTLSGAGTATCNGDYIQQDSITWAGSNEDIFLESGEWNIRYSGFPVRYKNTTGIFPFGVWTTVTGTVPPPYATVATIASQPSMLTIYTSVRQSYDYRFVEDVALVTASAVVTDFESNLNIPFVFPTDSVPVEN